ncbi:AraC family transcriptional regulator [Pedobacter nototheniae]|uniref:AraC family transcriptional regulator n=1 Tax=Pedobacter nototheniae TaxID=2488994 RepID=UPI00292FC851|nr:AraC family transcriptional regulator [Pedobacter nototheniae]
MDNRSRFCHLTVDSVTKPAYVWHEKNWKFTDEVHAHKMGQLIFVEKGLQYLHTENTQYLLPTFHCAWIPPGMVHKTTSPLEEVFLRCIFFEHVPDHPFFKSINVFNTPAVLREMILFTEQWSRLDEFDETEAAFVNALIQILPSTFHNSLPLVLPVPKNPRLAGIVDFMVENLLEGITVPRIAKQFNVSSRTIERLFKDDIGLTVAGYVKLLKMIKSVELLSAQGAGVKQVAMQVGYNSISTFSNTFFQVLGIRPQDMMLKA